MAKRKHMDGDKHVDKHMLVILFLVKFITKFNTFNTMSLYSNVTLTVDREITIYLLDWGAPGCKLTQ